MVRFLRKAAKSGVALYGFSTALGSGVPVFLMPILVQRLSPSDYGLTAIFQVMVTVGALLTSLGLECSLSRDYLVLPEEDRCACVGTILVSILAQGVLLACLMPAVGSSVAAATGIPARWFGGVIAACICQQVVNAVLIVLQMEFCPWKYFAIRSLQAFSDVVFSLLFIVVFHWDWRGRVLAVVFSSMIGALTGLLILRNARLFKFAFRFSYWRSSVVVGGGALLHSLAATGFTSLDRLVLQRLLDTRAVGVYTVASQAASSLSLLITAIHLAWTPWIFAQMAKWNERPELKIEVLRNVYLFHVLYLILGVLVGGAVYLALQWLAPAGYSEAPGLSLAVSLGFAVNGMYKSITNIVLFAGKTWRLSVVTSVSASIALAAMAAMLQRWGLKAAGFGFLIGNVLLLLGCWRLAISVTDLPCRQALVALLRRTGQHATV